MTTTNLDAHQAERRALLAAARALDKRIRGLVRVKRKNMAAIGYALRRMHDKRLHESLGCSSISEYALKVGAVSSRTQARELLALVRQLDGLPLLRRLFREALADWTKLREAARVATPKTEAEWVVLVLEKTCAELRRRAQLERGESPTVRRSQELTLEEDASIQAAIRRVRETTGESLTDGQALKMICDGAAVGGRDGSPTTRVVIQRCPDCKKATRETSDGPVEISAEALAEAECNAEILDITDGRPASITRTVPPRVANFVHARDRGRCRFPGCTNLGFLHVHHEGGRQQVGHDPNFMLLVCSGHHSARHRGKYDIEPLGRGAFEFRLVDGSILTSGVSRETPEASDGAATQRETAQPISSSEAPAMPDVG
jgi:hypothetical protein